MQIQKALHVFSLEVKCCDTTGGPINDPMVWPMWDAHDEGEDVEVQEDNWMRESDVDVPKEEMCVDVREVQGNIFQLVWEGGGRASIRSGKV